MLAVESCKYQQKAAVKPLLYFANNHHVFNIDSPLIVWQKKDKIEKLNQKDSEQKSKDEFSGLWYFDSISNIALCDIWWNIDVQYDDVCFLRPSNN